MDKNSSKRNKPCHCGSGKKYKNCHNSNETKRSNLWLFILLPFLLFAYFFIPNDDIPEKTNIKPFSSNENTNVFSQPGKKAPPGKVWSPEHNHWHDAPVGLEEKTKESPLSPVPQGIPPQGKIWSPEHNHWHDENSHK